MSEPTFDFEGAFDADYLYFYADRLDRSTDSDTELIWQLLEVEAGMEVLDLACGHGRIAPDWPSGDATSRASTLRRCSCDWPVKMPKRAPLRSITFTATCATCHGAHDSTGLSTGSPRLATSMTQAIGAFSPKPRPR